MKNLFVTVMVTAFLWAALTFAKAGDDAANPLPQELSALKARLQAALPPGWKMSYDSSTQSFLFEQTKDVLGMTITPSMPTDVKPAPGHYWFWISIVPYLSKETYAEIQRTNGELDEEAQKIETKLMPNTRVMPKGGLSCSNDPQKEIAIEQYIKLKAALYNLPDAHFQNIGLSWVNYPEFTPQDEQAMFADRKVRDAEEALFEKY